MQPTTQTKLYEKAELAMLYFPHSSPKAAQNRLARWIKNIPELYVALQRCNVKKYSKFYSRQQVDLIFHYLDEP